MRKKKKTCFLETNGVNTLPFPPRKHYNYSKPIEKQIFQSLVSNHYEIKTNQMSFWKQTDSILCRRRIEVSITRSVQVWQIEIFDLKLGRRASKRTSTAITSIWNKKILNLLIECQILRIYRFLTRETFEYEHNKQKSFHTNKTTRKSQSMKISKPFYFISIFGKIGLVRFT